MLQSRHGGALDRAIARYGGSRQDWLDLSTGINPIGYPVPNIAADVWQRLPDEALVNDCLSAARAFYQVPDAARIIVAPGTQAIIQWLPVLYNFLDKVSIVSPTYNEYAKVFSGFGAQVNTPGDLHRSGANPLLIVGQPNNPDGRCWPVEDLTAFASGEGGVRAIIVDEAFCDVAPEHSTVPASGENGLLVLKSFGKFFGLAGLRLGFAIGDPDVIESLGQMLGPWAASGPALAVAATAMRDDGWIIKTRARLVRDSAVLANTLEHVGFEVAARSGLFVLAQHPRARRIARELTQRHVLVRIFDHDQTWIRFGLPGDEKDFLRLKSALAEII